MVQETAQTFGMNGTGNSPYIWHEWYRKLPKHMARMVQESPPTYGMNGTGNSPYIWHEWYRKLPLHMA